MVAAGTGLGGGHVGLAGNGAGRGGAAASYRRASTPPAGRSHVAGDGARGGAPQVRLTTTAEEGTP